MKNHIYLDFKERLPTLINYFLRTILARFNSYINCYGIFMATMQTDTKKTAIKAHKRYSANCCTL